MRPADARDGRGLRVRGGAMALPDIGVDDRIHSACANPALWSPSNFNVSLVYAATTPSKGLLACGYTPASFGLVEILSLVLGFGRVLST